MAFIQTKGFIVEQIKRRINGGNPSAAKNFKDEDITAALCNSINARLKMDFLGTLSVGETIPEGCQMNTYTGDAALQVEKYNNQSIARLPIVPIKMMRDMGVFHVSRDGEEDVPFIPIQSGLMAYVRKQKLINTLLGQIGYTPGYDKNIGPYLLFTEDLTAEAPTPAIMVKLIVSDIFDLDDYDPLPITAEMAGDMIEEVYQKLVNKPAQDKIDDVTTVKP